MEYKYPISPLPPLTFPVLTLKFTKINIGYNGPKMAEIGGVGAPGAR